MSVTQNYHGSTVLHKVLCVVCDTVRATRDLPASGTAARSELNLASVLALLAYELNHETRHPTENLGAALCEKSFVEKFGEGWRVVTPADLASDPAGGRETGIVLHDLSKTYYVICRGTQVPADWGDNLRNLFIGCGARLDRAMVFVTRAQDLSSSDAGSRVIVTGHSLGGLVARHCGVLAKVKYYTLNAPHFYMLSAWSVEAATSAYESTIGIAARRHYSLDEFISAEADMAMGQGIESYMNGDPVSAVTDLTTGWRNWTGSVPGMFVTNVGPLSLSVPFQLLLFFKMRRELLPAQSYLLQGGTPTYPSRFQCPRCQLARGRNHWLVTPSLRRTGSTVWWCRPVGAL